MVDSLLGVKKAKEQVAGGPAITTPANEHHTREAPARTPPIIYETAGHLLGVEGPDPPIGKETTNISSTHKKHV